MVFQKIDSEISDTCLCHRNMVVGSQGLKLQYSLMFMPLTILHPKDYLQQMIYRNIIILVINLEITVS